MDEVLTHALVLDEGESLFKKSDIPLEMSSEEADKTRPLI
jgi:hypothetical protein